MLFSTSIWAIGVILVFIVMIVILISHIYMSKRFKSYQTDEGDVVDSSAYLKILQSDKTQIENWISEHKNELLTVEADRKEQEILRGELAKLIEDGATVLAQNEFYRKEVGELENQKFLLTSNLTQQRNELAFLEKSKKEYDEIVAQLPLLKKEVEDAKVITGKVYEYKAELENLIMKQNQQREEINKLEAIKKEYNEITAQLPNLKEQESSARDIIVKAIEFRVELEKLEKVIVEKRQELQNNGLELEKIKKKYNEINIQLVDREKESEKEKAKIAEELKNLKITQNKTDRQLQEKRSELKVVTDKLLEQKETIDHLRAKEAVLSSKIETHRKEMGEETEEDSCHAYIDLIGGENLDCLKEKDFENPNLETDEDSALKTVRTKLAENNYIFPKRIIDAFHTSLKSQSINPLTVLAGVSGTGKTLLPKCYADIMGMHSHIMAVQPRWDSPQDLFGFYNVLEKKYKATDLSRALFRMDQYQGKVNDHCSWTQDRMLLVLLDEMNLARTEYYFSEFLSKLELRRQVDENESSDRSKASVELSDQYKVWINSNVLFVGTMNEDETTQTLSDKVLDRANVLRFGRPAKRTENKNGSSANRMSSHGKYLSHKTWNSWIKKPQNTGWSDDVSRWITELNEALDSIGRPFGYRVEDAVMSYVANYPKVESRDRYKLAFADQIEQKILPKLRGADCDEAGSCLRRVSEIISETNDEALKDAFDEAQTNSRSVGTFQWRGVTRKDD
ncbi:AAA family ATPase [Maridesulfovibrio ferrireducens]|uniref:AAA family ATPase n=1 Tax=Maridesulfovibrio ferrireducens TaxID=246191 RepID=UPI001A1C4F57|nr:AAA family ATPase [Maridesulfovibrio ferrireducens]MBI9109947.1 AAA family ATPase [Maridesulfovibrio ferrireducens]